jgi:O-acetyl-ADP-ribose deacetylase (regulator of RNase III)
LPARYVIHTVGPIWQGGHAEEERLLASCYRAVVTLAAEHKASELAFPAISCGVYGFPKTRAAEIAVRTLRSLQLDELGIRRVSLVAFDEDMQRLYQLALDG